MKTNPLARLLLRFKGPAAKLKVQVPRTRIVGCGTVTETHEVTMSLEKAVLWNKQGR